MKILKAAADVRISGLILPGGWEKKLDQGRVNEHAESLRQGRLLPPARANKARKLNYGFHRLAAALKLGRKTLFCEIVAYDSPEEERIDALCENLRRVNPTGRERTTAITELAELVKRRLAGAADEPEIEEKSAENEENDDADRNHSGSGSRQTPTETEVNSETARLANTSQTAVARARAAAKEPPEPEAVPEAPPPPCLDWFDLEPIADVETAARKVQAIVDEADGKLKGIARLLTALEEAGLENAECQSLRRLYDDMAYEIRRARPKSACCWCKGRDRAPCVACAGSGYLLEKDVDSVDIPAELKLRGEKAVVANGRGGFRPLGKSKAEKKLEIRVIDPATGEDRPAPEEPDEGLAF